MRAYERAHELCYNRSDNSGARGDITDLAKRLKVSPEPASHPVCGRVESGDDSMTCALRRGAMLGKARLGSTLL